MSRRRSTPWVLAVLAVLVPVLLAAPGEPRWHPISGDEPHYLVIAQSLVRDGDVDVGNQYREQQYWSYYPAELAPHTKPGHDPGSRYSMHGVGLGAWLAPWVAAAGPTGPGDREPATFPVLWIRLAMAVWLGALALALWHLVDDLAGPVAATAGTAAAIFTSPLLFFGPHVFTEVPAAALSAAAYLLLRRRRTGRHGPGALLAAGVALAALPWLHFKYALVAAVLATLGAWTELRRTASPPEAAGEDVGAWSRGLRLTALLAVPALSALGHLAFTWSLHRSLSPLSLYVGSGDGGRATAFGGDLGAYLANLPGAAITAVGYLMDQKEGLLFHAPWYLLAVAGLAWMIHGRDGEGRTNVVGLAGAERPVDAVALGAVLLALWVPYAVSHETGHWSPPARPLAAVLWTLAVPAGIALALPWGAMGGAGGAVGPAGRSGGGGAQERPPGGNATADVPADEAAPSRPWRRRLAAVAGGLLAWGIAMTLLHAVQSDLLYHDVGADRSLILQRYGAPGLPVWSLFPVWLQVDEPSWGVGLAWLAVVFATGVWLWRQGRAAAEVGVTATRTGAGEGRSRAFFGAAGAVAFALAAAVALHVLLVPVTALHRPWAFGGPVSLRPPMPAGEVPAPPGALTATLRVWEPVSPPQRAWPEEELAAGVWVGGDDVTELLVSAPLPLGRVELELFALGSVEYVVELGGDRESGATPGGVRQLLVLEPGRGQAWGDEVFYRLRVVCDGGARPSALGMGDDGRNLGVQIRPVFAAGGT